MTTVKDIVGLKPVEGSLGVEIEVEGAGDPLPVVDNDTWTTVSEGSIRSGLEYVSKKPMVYGSGLIDKFKSLINQIDKPEYKIIYDSHRTSTHVHVDVLNYTPVQVWTAVTAYWLLENVLFKYCGKEREGNQFCLRLKDAEGLLDQVEMDLNNKYPFSMLDSTRIRYAGLNLRAINRHGSLEFRGMRGTLDPDTLHDWSKICYDIIYITPHKFKNPEELLDFYYKHGPKSLATTVLSPRSYMIFSSTANFDDLMEENACRITAFAYGRDWSKYSESIEKTYSKPKKARPTRPWATAPVSIDEVVNSIPNPPSDWWINNAGNIN